MANARDRINSTDSTSEGRPSCTIYIPTPSWRVIDEYDYHESGCDDHESDNDIHESESNHSNDFDESDSSETSNSSWVSPDTISEYILPNNIICDMKIEIRLINLTDIQIQALRKKFKCGIYTPKCMKSPLYLTCVKGNRDIESQNYEESNEPEDEYMKRTRPSRNTRERALCSPSRNKEKVDIAHCTELSKSGLKELARLQFSNAGPRMKMRTNRGTTPLQRVQQKAREYKTRSPTRKTDSTQQNKHADVASTILTKVIETGDKDANLTLKEGEEKLDEEQLLQDEQTVILMEDYNIDEIEVILADDGHNGSKIADETRPIESNKLTDESLYHPKETYSRNKNIFEDNLDVIMSYVSSDTDDDN